MTTDADAGFDPGAVLARIEAATGELLRTAARLSDADVRAPSLLPGWSRGHVLTHLARNADGGRHLLVWARTGVETPEYPSTAARDEQIEAGAGRGAEALVADLRESAGRFAAEYRRMTAGMWSRSVRWTRGQERPAARAADSRLTEVLVHHVDLAAGYTPEQWPADFVEAMLGRVVASFGARAGAPAMRLRATDTHHSYGIGAEDPGDPAVPGDPVDPAAPLVEGPGNLLLAWLMGRDPGTGLSVRDGAPLPEPPFLY